MLGRFRTIARSELGDQTKCFSSSFKSSALGLFNIRPYYPLGGQRWGLIGDLTAYLTSKIGPRGGAFDFGIEMQLCYTGQTPYSFLCMVEVGI